ncbi:hypothetical protein MLD38_035200 [Melastoma candidum]|uniref:Uncharacterized protein n=1 Tax=Melastoma candidum TaxID=119954 RepID=A0ACB9MC09_9MYRT|nr:hypothetical protein MLD38_035200 [Melastoma candidum]
MGAANLEKKWMFPLFVSSLLCIFLLATSFNLGLVSSLRSIDNIFSLFPSLMSTNGSTSPFVDSKVSTYGTGSSTTGIPRFAYLVSGSKGDLNRLWRTLRVLYHPRNQYVVHLDLESPARERLELVSRVENDPLFAKVGNVHVIAKSNMVTYRGPTMVANTLHACAVLLKKSKDWDWFINLSASDYPLVTQDDLMYAFSSLRRDVNFIEHTSRLGWKAYKRAMPLIVDPGLYMSKKSDIFWVSPRRALPTAFKLFTGSAWMILSRSFVEYCIWGWENLPRVMLMYYANFVSSPEGYFQTVICNSPEFRTAALNHDMHYIAWDNPPKQHPRTLTLNEAKKMIDSGAPFARKFARDSPVLDKIDKELLGRGNGSFSAGGWCSGEPECSEVGSTEELRPGPGAQRLQILIAKLMNAVKQGHKPCR